MKEIFGVVFFLLHLTVCVTQVAISPITATEGRTDATAMTVAAENDPVTAAETTNTTTMTARAENSPVTAAETTDTITMTASVENGPVTATETTDITTMTAAVENDPANAAETTTNAMAENATPSTTKSTVAATVTAETKAAVTEKAASTEVAMTEIDIASRSTASFNFPTPRRTKGNGVTAQLPKYNPQSKIRKVNTIYAIIIVITLFITGSIVICASVFIGKFIFWFCSYSTLLEVAEVGFPFLFPFPGFRTHTRKWKTAPPN